MADIIDVLKYEGLEVDEKLAQAHSEVWNSEQGKVVLADLITFCGYGMYSDDVDRQRTLIERQAIINRIKAFLNGKPTEPEEEENYE